MSFTQETHPPFGTKEFPLMNQSKARCTKHYLQKNMESIVSILVASKLEDRFTYLFAVNYDQDVQLPAGLTKLQIPDATYAVFRTPLVEVEQFVSSIKGTWQYILEDWLPQSLYEVDETSYDFEYYDEHCHDWEYEKIYMEIYLPIKEKNRE